MRSRKNETYDASRKSTICGLLVKRAALENRRRTTNGLCGAPYPAALDKGPTGPSALVRFKTMVATNVCFILDP